MVSRNGLPGAEVVNQLEQNSLLGEVLANTENLRAPGAAQPEGSEQ